MSTTHRSAHLAALLLLAGIATAAPQGGTPSNVNVDVLVVHTTGSATLYSGGIQTRINHVLNVANRAYADSEVGITLRLAAAVPVAYSDTATSSASLTAIRSGTAPFTSVEAWRTQYGADMVVLMRKYSGDGYAGLGYVGGIGTQGNLSGYRPYMYSNVAINTSDYVLAHELGHNMGLVHSRKQDPNGGTYSYSAGYGIQGVLVEIMAYTSAFGVSEAQKVYQFSSPLHTVDGHALGIVKTNASTGADSVASLNAVRDTLAGFTPSKQFLTSRVGEFGGDGRTDLFRNDPDDNANYLWLTGTSSAPADGFGDALSTTSVPAARLVASGDFDGDGDGDVLFRTPEGDNIGWLIESGEATEVEFPALSGSYWSVAGSGDLDADGDDDIVWRNGWNGANQVWLMDGANAPSAQALATVADVKWRIDTLGDFNGDGKADLFWRNYSTGNDMVWLMNGATLQSQAMTTKLADLGTKAIGAGDFDGDGDDDVLFNNASTGANTIWYMSGTSVASTVPVQGKSALRCIGIGDFDGDGLRDDIAWNNAAAEEDVLWMMSGGAAVSQISLKSGRDLLDDIHVVADVDGDAKCDIVWRNTGTGANRLWLMDGAVITESAATDALSGGTLRIVRAGDFDGDGKQDLLWHNGATRQLKVWLMDGATVVSKHDLATIGDAKNEIVGVGDLSGDGKDDLVLRHSVTGANTLWVLNGGAAPVAQALPLLSDLSFKLAAVADTNADGKADLLWRSSTTGINSLWLMNGATRTSTAAVNKLADVAWKVAGTGDFNGDGKPDLLWRHATNGKNSIWMMNGPTVLGSSGATTQLADVKWQVEGLGDFDGDGKCDILWQHTGTQDRHVWLMNGLGVSANTKIY